MFSNKSGGTGYERFHLLFFSLQEKPLFHQLSNRYSQPKKSTEAPTMIRNLNIRNGFFYSFSPELSRLKASKYLQQ